MTDLPAHAFEPAVVFICLALGGVLKGATGAGAPTLAVPALAAMYDVRVAVVVMLMPNLLTNLWQAWRYRSALISGPFPWTFAGGGAAGMLAGTLLLAALPLDALAIVVVAAVLVYVALRAMRPDFVISRLAAERVSIPFGLAAGALQGASGLGAPIILTFLNALALDRQAFVSTVAIFLAATATVQLPALAWLGILSPHGVLISLAAIVPIMTFMPVGAYLARRISRQTFDRLILLVLVVLAGKLASDAAA